MDPKHRVEELLVEQGFKENPFTLREPDREGRRRAVGFFYQHPVFPQVLGNSTNLESTIVLAQRGAGKTTFRQEIEYLCRQDRRPVKGLLDVSYIDFGPTLAAANWQVKNVNISLHVQQILRCAVIRLLESVNELRISRYEELSAGQVATLSAFVRNYSPVLNDDDQGHSAADLLKHIAEENEIQLTSAQQRALDRLFVDSASAVSLMPLLLQPIAELLIRLRHQEPRPLQTASYLQLVREFIDLLFALGYKGMYVLVDKLDETSLLGTPLIALKFVTPLITDIGLLDEPGLAFKIFLPQHMDELITTRIDFRRKRLPVKYLVWSEDDLLSLLARRLQSFNTRRISSMQTFCEPSLASQVVNFSTAHQRARAVDVALVKASNNLPRDLILRCRLLLEIFEARQSQGLVIEEDLREAVTTQLPSDDPPSRLLGATMPTQQQRHSSEAVAKSSKVPTLGIFIDEDNEVWRSGQRLGSQLSATEFKLLEYLFKRKHQVCVRQDIARTLWGDTDQAVGTLNTTLMRLREVIEYDPNKPRFILTVHGRGIELTDGQPGDSDEQR